MKTNTSAKLSSRRPGEAMSAEDKLSKLKALEQWTETPTVDAADAIAENTPNTTPKPAKPVKALKKAVGEGDYPWNVVNEEVTTQFVIRLDKRTHAKLKYLGDTTYGQSMHTLVLKLVHDYVDKAIKERGLE